MEKIEIKKLLLKYIFTPFFSENTQTQGLYSNLESL